MEKTNIEHLRDIIEEFQTHDSIKAEEAKEFLDAIDQELRDKVAEIESLEREIPDDDDDEKEAEYDNSDFVGLDTINWSLDMGNLKIQTQVEQFIHNLKKQNLVTA